MNELNKKPKNATKYAWNVAKWKQNRNKNSPNKSRTSKQTKNSVDKEEKKNGNENGKMSV